MAGHDHHGHHPTTADPHAGHVSTTSMDPHAHHHDGMDGSMDHGMMKMYFHASVSEVILFKDWNPQTVGGLVGSMIGIFLMAVFYEGLKYYREYLFRKTYAASNFNCIGIAGEGPKVLSNPLNSVRHRMLQPSHLLQTTLHMFQVTLSYFLMLIFMTYNVWLCLAVVLGAGVGFFVFGWKKAIVVDITEHCH